MSPPPIRHRDNRGSQSHRQPLSRHHRSRSPHRSQRMMPNPLRSLSPRHNALESRPPVRETRHPVPESRPPVRVRESKHRDRSRSYDSSSAYSAHSSSDADGGGGRNYSTHDRPPIPPRPPTSSYADNTPRYKMRGGRKNRAKRENARRYNEAQVDRSPGKHREETEQQYNNSVERFLQDTTRALKQRPPQPQQTRRAPSPRTTSRHRPLPPQQGTRPPRSAPSNRNTNGAKIIPSHDGRPSMSTFNRSSRQSARPRRNTPNNGEIVVSHQRRIEESRMIVEQDRRERARFESSRINNNNKPPPPPHIPTLLPAHGPSHFPVSRLACRTRSPPRRGSNNPNNNTNIAPVRRSAHERLGIRVNVPHDAHNRPVMRNISQPANQNRRCNIRDRLGLKFDARNVINPRINSVGFPCAYLTLSLITLEISSYLDLYPLISNYL